MFFYINKSKKGFSLIELIVVMGIMAILVLVAVPKFIGHTKEANLTKIKANIKEIESASDRYYLKNDDWPRAINTPYTAEQLETYAHEIKTKTGAIVKLEENGKYYPIDYDKLQKYIKKPRDGVQYILQNPVGEVFYLDKLTDNGKLVFNPNKEDSVNHKPIAVISMSPEEDLTTSTIITWSYANSICSNGNQIINTEWEGAQTTYT